MVDEVTSAGHKAKTRVAVVPHTHWDREWYSAFQTFRLRLVDLLDELLPGLEADPSYAHFMLDGQMAAIDDYLAVRPQEEERLRRLAASGRISVGPWYVLMDEFLVSGETIVRDLQLGLRRAAAFGGAMEVGYLPDMFGHVAQMPQLLRLAGFEHAVVWRGVPSAVDRTAFVWAAPDGSSVRAEYLWVGYGNGAAIPDDAKALLARLRGYDDELGAARVGDILWMNGTDHQPPQPWLGRVVAEANEIQDDYEIVVTSLAEHLAAAPDDPLPSWRGELRSGARANLLMGVTSNRVDVRVAAARSERALERFAEPLSALFLPPDRWPAALLDEAWLSVIRNAAHDSVCACSVDDVVDAVLHRYAEARQIGEGLGARALGALGRSMGSEGSVVVNATARPRSGLVELVVPGTGEGTLPGCQVLAAREATLLDTTMKGSDLAGVLGQIRSQQLSDDTYVNAVTVHEDDDGIEIVLHADARLRENLLVEEVKRDLHSRASRRPDTRVHVTVQQPPSTRLLTRVQQVPGFGWKQWAPEVLDCDPVSVTAGGVGMVNGLLAVEVDMATGTFSLDGVAGYARLVNGGDHGDTYNYSPPDDDEEIDEPISVEAAVIESGPLRASIDITRRYRWPSHGDRSARTRGRDLLDIEVVTSLELRAGEPFLRVTNRFDNRCRDHRLRAILPLPQAATSSRAECAYAIVERGLDAEGGPSERALPTFPSKRFVFASGLTVLHDGVAEYELVDGGAALALTLLRATGMLSGVDLTYRPLPAGPPIPIEGPQMIGQLTSRFALAVGDHDPYELADDFLLPLHVANAPGGGSRPDEGSALIVDGAEVSAVVRVGGCIEIRVFNPTDAATVVRIDGGRGWLVDLRGAPVEPFDGEFPLRPHGIATARLTGT